MVMRMEKMYHRKTSAIKGRPIYTENDIDDFLLAEQQREPVHPLRRDRDDNAAIRRLALALSALQTTNESQ